MPSITVTGALMPNSNRIHHLVMDISVEATKGLASFRHGAASFPLLLPAPTNSYKDRRINPRASN